MARTTHIVALSIALAMASPVWAAGQAPAPHTKALEKLKKDVARSGKTHVEVAPTFRVGKASGKRRPKGAPRDLPFQAGEELHYELTWMGIPVGHATFSVLPPARFEGKPVWQFGMEARTNSFADRIYKVRDLLLSWTTPDMKRSVHHTKRAREGSYHRDIIVTFDAKKSTATYRNTKKIFDPRPIFPDTWDPLGLLYGFRCQKFDKPGSVIMSVTDGLKTIRADVRVVRREEVEIGGEAIDSWKVEPDMKDVGGIFKRSPGARMEVWVSTDSRHIPLKLRSKVIVGSFTATLVSATGLRR